MQGVQWLGFWGFICAVIEWTSGFLGRLFSEHRNGEQQLQVVHGTFLRCHPGRSRFQKNLKEATATWAMELPMEVMKAMERKRWSGMETHGKSKIPMPRVFQFQTINFIWFHLVLGNLFDLWMLIYPQIHCLKLRCHLLTEQLIIQRRRHWHLLTKNQHYPFPSSELSLKMMMHAYMTYIDL